MNTARPNKALLIVDMINDFLTKGSPLQVPAGRWIVENIAGEINYARDKTRPIIYVCDQHPQEDPQFAHCPPHAVAGTEGADIIYELAPKPYDHVIHKSGYSGFFRTELGALLDELGIDEVLICGVLTNVGVLYTAMDALQRGFRVIVPETCVAALTEADHKFALQQVNAVLRPVPPGEG